MTLGELFISPFADFAFMRNALAACLFLAVGSAPVGVFLVLRRMSLVGDALSHAVLPGAALGFLVAGLSLPAMTIGGAIAGLAVALLSGLLTRAARQQEDASFAVMYLTSLALGVLLVSYKGSSVDLMHVLFGSVLAVDRNALLVVACIASFSALALAAGYRLIVAECFDPLFLRSVGAPGWAAHYGLLALLVLNLVAGFSALGTLLSVGLMMLPATAARFWAVEAWSMIVAAVLLAALSGVMGLLISFHGGVPSGPAIILSAAGLYVLSMVAGPRAGLLRRWLRYRHLSG